MTGKAVMFWQWNRDDKNETANLHDASLNRTRVSILLSSGRTLRQMTIKTERVLFLT